MESGDKILMGGWGDTETRRHGDTEKNTDR